MELKELMEEENLHLQKLSDLVKQSIDEEQLLSSKLLKFEQDTKLSFSQSLADKVADFGGSWRFIIGFFVVLSAWMLLNTYMLKQSAFDPYPFIFLNLVLSCLAAIQAPIIMMSQNRREEKDRIRARSDFMINLKAEMEIRSLHSKIDLLIAEQMKSLFTIQQLQTEMLQKIQNSIQNIEKNSSN